MAFVFRTLRLVPTAIRVTVAGGVTYGTVKAGAWSDSSDSREKLDKVQESISNLREIEYPPMEHIQSAHPQVDRLSANQIEVGALRSSLTQSWNNAVKSACEAVVRDEGSKVESSLKSLTDRFSQWTK
ncbi:uncharacterized protein LOC135336624 [Halichondria panicea]|uniref:uncharacterized protein LOC135336624 n=1 Tax=Halichondria panicea TaxID=6063 RepID=UPI00312BB317